MSALKKASPRGPVRGPVLGGEANSYSLTPVAGPILHGGI